MAELAPFGTRLMSWYPLGHGDKRLLCEPIIVELAERYRKSAAQILLRWHTQMGFVVIPGSSNAAHIRENFNIFDFTLTDAEMAAIAQNITIRRPSRRKPMRPCIRILPGRNKRRKRR